MKYLALLAALIGCDSTQTKLEKHLGPGATCYTDVNGHALCTQGRTLHKCNYNSGLFSWSGDCVAISCLNEIPYNNALGPCEGERAK